MTVNGTKTWAGDVGHEDARPANITVTLYADGTKNAEQVVCADANGNWTWSFTDLPKYNAGQEIVYTIGETPVQDYTASITGDAATGFNITNTYEPELVTVSGTKTWVGDKETNRPASITVILYADGTKTAEQVVSSDANGKWSWSFANLPKYSAGKAIVYTIGEVKVPGYTTTINGYNITNRYSPVVTPTPSPTPTPVPTVTPTPAPTPTAKPGSGPRTGDESNIALWAGLGLVSIAAAAGAVLLIKKRGKAK